MMDALNGFRNGVLCKCFQNGEISNCFQNGVLLTVFEIMDALNSFQNGTLLTVFKVAYFLIVFNMSAFNSFKNNGRY